MIQYFVSHVLQQNFRWDSQYWMDCALVRAEWKAADQSFVDYWLKTFSKHYVVGMRDAELFRCTVGMDAVLNQDKLAMDQITAAKDTLMGALDMTAIHNTVLQDSIQGLCRMNPQDVACLRQQSFDYSTWADDVQATLQEAVMRDAQAMLAIIHDGGASF